MAILVSIIFNVFNAKIQIRLENIKIERLKRESWFLKNIPVTKWLPWQRQICWTQDTHAKMFPVKF